MHAALDVPEVVELICTEIAADRPKRLHAGLPILDYPSRCEDLARLACTCTSFIEPALDALWSHQDTLIHLLRTIPEDVWDIIGMKEEAYDSDESDSCDSSEDEESLEIIFKRATTADDWTRFLFYSQRVKSFEDTSFYRKTSNVYDVLAATFPGGFIFPRLESLNWYPNAQTLRRTSRLFLSPGITRIELRASCFADERLPKLMTNLRALKHIHISGPGSVAAVSRFICGQSDLETLVVDELNLTAFAHIARLPCLRVCWLWSQKFSHLPTAPNNSPLFPGLHNFECASLTSAPKLLEWTGSSLLEFRLSAKSWDAVPVKGDFRELYSAIASHCRPDKLREICIGKPCCARVPPQHLAHYLVSVEELRPLFVFQNLVCVTLSHSPCVDLDDAAAVEMARSWPHIQELHFRSDTKHRITPRITLEGIAAFAEHCPELEDLTILFDATDVPKLKVKTSKWKRKTNRVAQYSLERLDVGYSPVSPKPQRVAEFLCAIFPCLTSIHTPYLNEKEATQDAQLVASRKGWRRVQDAL
ncbi:hypothetical protein FB45DRAFT_1008570 [Roridomyces roridus]|uniref:F-box domain-containing protein n=1 Tax=Roridomyces roridus TaxID=1738132 RepID=A0AAD7BAE2_9AGAR|nr:hypothetical protein FB45DRAFT_1008570 [Roridomyces roridus]